MTNTPAPAAASGSESEPVAGRAPDGSAAGVSPLDAPVVVDDSMVVDDDDDDEGGVLFCNSVAPMSAVPFEIRAYGAPRWSKPFPENAATGFGPASIAGDPGFGSIVSVGPKLLARP